MISLADDRYIDEIFQDKITGRRRNIFVTFTAVAAALALVAGGISYFVSNAGNTDKITADDPAVSELGIVDYSLYFQNTDESTMEADGDKGVLAEATGISCHFSDSEYVKSAMPFDMSRFVNAECQFFYDYKDEVRGIMIHADDRTDDKQENVKMLDVEVYERGELFSLVSLGKCKSMKRFDVDVYGFDFREEDNTVGVLFAMDGKEYLIGGNYMSFDEIGIIMDSVIENGLWTDSFDLSKAEMEYGDISADITLEEANMIMPFAGYVPQIHKFGDMRLNYNKVSYCAGRDEANNIVPQWLYLAYYDDGEQDICLQYFTEDADVQPLEKTVSIYDIELDKLSEYRDGDNHAFTVDYGGFKVNIWTNNCNDNELLNCLTAMRIGADGVVGSSFEDISLIEANNIVPYVGYVPQTESIGSMRVTSVYYEESKYNGSVEDNAVIVNLMDDNDKHMMLHYGNFKEKVRDKYVPLAEVYDRFESFSEQSEYNADCKQYSFTIDCGNFWIKINADCTPEEMKMCLDEICHKENKSITLAEANKIAPFEGYVPQNETAGDMKLGLVQYNGSNIVLDYSFSGENRFSYIGLTYTADKRMTENYSVITLEQLDEGDIVFRRDDDNRSNINFAVDCGGFYVCIDGEKCTTAELYDCIITTLLERSRHLPVGEDVTLAAAKDIEPFGVYVPARESGVLKPEKGILNYHNENGIKEPLSLHFTFSDSDSGDSLIFVYQKDTVDFSAMPSENIIPIENIDWSTVNNFVENNTTFLLDCGEVKILVSPECLVSPVNYVGQVWYYIEQIKNSAMFYAAERDGKLITLDKVKELAKKGDDLTWSDFEDYYGVDVGSGLYIMYYAVEGTDYSVTVGGDNPYEKPMYIRFGKGDGNYIDLRYDSLYEILGEKIPLYAVDSENGNLLTIEKVKELAKKGEDLTWSDFEEFSGVDVGSGMYIMVYPVEDTDYRVTVGGSPDRKPMYIHFGKGDGNYIDLRKDSIDEFLS